jgi:hypothetical protein
VRLGGRSDERRHACGTSVVAAAISKCHVFRGTFPLACCVTHPHRASSRPFGECRRWQALAALAQAIMWHNVLAFQDLQKRYTQTQK